jgi:hypothetical protein
MKPLLKANMLNREFMVMLKITCYCSFRSLEILWFPWLQPYKYDALIDFVVLFSFTCEISASCTRCKSLSILFERGPCCQLVNYKLRI